jgi:DNA repair exonuclease SbcCD ATPase subunit
LRFVSRTAFLNEDLRSDDAEPDLRSHLCRAYSLDNLQRALIDIEPALTDANRNIRAARSELNATQSELDAARREYDQLSGEVSRAHEVLTAARAAHAPIREELDRAIAAREKQHAATVWDEQHNRLLGEIEPLVGQSAPGVTIDDELLAAEKALSADVEALRSQQAQLRAQLDSIEASLASLHDATARCPVCLRELDDDSRQHAEHRHQETLNTAWETLSHLDSSDISQRLELVRKLRRDAAALGERPTVEGIEGIDDLVATEAQTQAAVEAAVAALSQAEMSAANARARVQDIAEQIEVTNNLARQYRGVALLEAAKDALNSTITSVLDQQLSPLTDLVNRRWQAVFADRPHLRLRPNGRISREVGGEGDELAFEAFSAGEKTVARLMMRITTLLSTTNVPFCFVDEPLEHLDPQSRRLVAGTLAHLSAGSGLEQIFVTTYEEPLARRLAELQPGRVHVQYLRAEPAR